MTARITGTFENFEGLPLGGVLEFVPRVPNATVTGSRAVHLPAPQIVPLDPAGRVDLIVVAPGPGSNPTDWVWEVRPRLTSEGRGVPWRPFLVHAPDGATVDLRDHVQVQAPSGEWITRGEPGPAGDPGPKAPTAVADVTVDGTELVLALTDGNTTRVPLPTTGGPTITETEPGAYRVTGPTVAETGPGVYSIGGP